MKIERIEALPLNAKIEKPFRIASTVFEEVRALIVRVITDDGLVGIGESVVRSAPRATKYIVEDMLAPLILGRDPLNAGALWWDMFSAMRLRGHSKGHFVEAISGVDVALWDIIGQATGLPTYKALHGFGRETLPAYGSSVFCAEPEKMAADSQWFLDQGYDAVKIKLGLGIREDVRAIEAIRRGRGGGRPAHGGHQQQIRCRLGRPAGSPAGAVPDRMVRGTGAAIRSEGVRPG